MKVVTFCLTKCCKRTSMVWCQFIWLEFTGNSGRSRKQGQGVMQWMQLVTLPAGRTGLSESHYIQDDWGWFQKISLNSVLFDFYNFLQIFWSFVISGNNFRWIYRNFVLLFGMCVDMLWPDYCRKTGSELQTALAIAMVKGGKFTWLQWPSRFWKNMRGTVGSPFLQDKLNFHFSNLFSLASEWVGYICSRKNSFEK